MKDAVTTVQKDNPVVKQIETEKLICCEVLDGLKVFALQELERRFQRRIELIPTYDPETIYMYYQGDLRDLFTLRTVVTVYLVENYAIPRPQALLGHQNYQTLLGLTREVLQLHPPQTFTDFRISAAGEDSRVFVRLRKDFAADTQLFDDPKKGNLLLRIRPSNILPKNWEVLIRLSPLPLSARAWRVINMKGALNATVAAAMVEMTYPTAKDAFINLMCGSGTLLIERSIRNKAEKVVGCDNDNNALIAARENIKASHLQMPIDLIVADATNLPFADATFHALCADLPWGQLTGSHEMNAELYPKLLIEAARIAKVHATFVVLTHEIQLFERILQDYTHLWKLQEVIKIFQGGLHPRIYQFKRLPS